MADMTTHRVALARRSALRALRDLVAALVAAGRAGDAAAVQKMEGDLPYYTHTEEVSE